MKVLFLDVDGVLNYEGSPAHTEDGIYLIDDNKLKVLKEFVDKTGVEIVLSSSWRRGWNLPIGDQSNSRFDVESSKDYFMLCAKLHDFGLYLLSEIPRVVSGNREEAICYWIDEWTGEKIENYVILDDEIQKFSNNNNHLIAVSSRTGLMPEHIEQACEILHIKEPVKKKALVVDDVEVNRAVVNAILTDRFNVFEAANGNEALLWLENNKDVDVVITDIQMPVMNGLELIRNIRLFSEYNHIVIIANTQFGEMNQEDEILDIGADDFIYKPANPKVIKHRVWNALLLKRKK